MYETQISGYSRTAPSGVAWHSPRTDPWFAVARAPRNDRAAFAALVIFTLILLLSPQNYFPFLLPLRLAFLSAFCAAAFLFWDRWSRAEPLLQVNRELLVVTAIPAWAAVTLPLSYWPSGSVSILTDAYLKAVAVFCLLMNIVTTPQRLKIIATTLFLCTIPITATALKNFVTGNFVAGSQEAGRILGYQNSLALNPNDMALMLNLLIPLGLALFFIATKPFLRALCLFIIGLDLVGVILTLSRAGFLGLATIALLYFLKLIRRPGSDRIWAFAVFLTIVVSLPFLPSNYLDRVGTIGDIDADPTGSAQARWRDNVAATAFVMKHPIVGAGIGMDVLALNDERGQKWKQVHNVYLEYAVDLGIPGLALFLMLFYWVWRAARSARLRVSSIPALRNLFLLAEALEVSLIVFAVAGFFHPVAYHFYFYYIAGLALGGRVAINNAVDRELQCAR